MSLYHLLLLIIFISVWLSLYVSLHYYVFIKFVQYVHQYKNILVATLILLACSVFLVEILSFTRFAKTTYRFADVSYYWMGLVFLFVVFSGSLDLAHKGFTRLKIEKVSKILNSTKRTPLVAILVLVLSVVGYMQARQINIQSIHLQSKKITKPVRIIQIADLHSGVQSNENHISEIVKTINALKPDIIVATGDLIEIHFGHTQRLSEILNGLKAKEGKYAIYGNHEAMVGVEESKKFINAAGFTILENEGITLNNQITLVGVNDPAVTASFTIDNKAEEITLAAFSSNLYTVLLKHQPRVNTGSTQYFDLQLSGHTHGGQIFPFGLLTRLIYPLGFGLSKVSGDTWVYVSQGIGTWGPPMRLGAKPEITVIDISPIT